MGEDGKDSAGAPKTGFDGLNDPQKIIAILGAVREPVTREMVLEFSGVNYGDLDNEAKKQVDDVFLGENIVKSEVEGSKRLILNEKGRQTLEKTLDMSSVHGAIAMTSIRKISGVLPVQDR